MQLCIQFNKKKLRWTRNELKHEVNSHCKLNTLTFLSSCLPSNCEELYLRSFVTKLNEGLAPSHGKVYYFPRQHIIGCNYSHCRQKTAQIKWLHRESHKGATINIGVIWFHWDNMKWWDFSSILFELLL